MAICGGDHRHICRFVQARQLPYSLTSCEADVTQSIWYRSAGRQIRRLQSVTPGLVNAIYGETIAGTAVIRAFGMQSVFLSELMGTLNVQINMFTWRHYIGRWLYSEYSLIRGSRIDLTISQLATDGPRTHEHHALHYTHIHAYQRVLRGIHLGFRGVHQRQRKLVDDPPRQL